MQNNDCDCPATPLLTPCVGVCRIGRTGLCEGCQRTLEEIARWSTLDADERRRWIAEVQPGRRAVRP